MFYRGVADGSEKLDSRVPLLLTEIVGYWFLGLVLVSVFNAFFSCSGTVLLLSCLYSVTVC